MRNGSRVRRTPQRFAVLSCLILTLAGCMTWHNPRLEPSALIDQRHPNAVRVERQDRTKVILYRPMISGDSLLGNISRKKTTAIPLSDVSNLSVQRVNGGLTALGLLFVGALVGMAVAISSINIAM
jgi:hypothetical protein